MKKSKSTKTNGMLKKLLGEVKETFVRDQSILSFEEYFSLLEKNTHRHLRSSAQYLVDAFDYFGTEERDLPTGKVKRFKIFDIPFDRNKGAVSGQELVQESLYRHFSNFARDGRINKMLLLYGPNGSAKSSLVRALMAGLEEYSHQAEGAVYSFSWIFPSESLSKGERIGFGGDIKTNLPEGSFAHLPSDIVDARVPCELHDHPLFLIPKAHRNKILDEMVDESDGKFVVSDYLRSGDLCQKCRSVYDTLLASYEGDAAQVLEHVQVNRFYLSRRYRRAIATIEPQASVDARIQQVTADRTLTALPKALQQVSLFEPTGPLVAANRGLLEFSDLFKRPVEAFKYLLDTIETGTVALDSFVLHLDMIFLASTNDTYLEAFKEHPDFPSFKGRIELIKVPYLLRFEDEKEIYARQTTERSVGRHIAPHALDVAALWAVLTRLRRNEASNYSKEFKAVIEKLTPLDKSHLFDTGKVPDGLSNRDAKELHHRVEELFLEGRSFSKYEGKMGASARELRTALLNAAHNPDYQCLSPLAVFEQIREILENRSVFPYLRQEASHGFHEHKKFLEQVEDVYLGWVDDEIRMSMGLAAEESYAQLFARYVRHASHWLKKEKIQDPVSGNFIKADEKFMEEIEAVLKGEKEAAKDFRAEVIGTIGAYSLENPDREPNYSEIFGAYIEKLREDYFAQRREQIGRINKNFLLYTAHDRKSLEPKELEHLEKMLGRLKERFGYCENCARDTVAYLVKKRYQ